MVVRGTRGTNQMGKNGDCRIPRAQVQGYGYKYLRRKEWENLHATAYNLMVVLMADGEDGHSFEQFCKEWRNHIALPTDVERWLEDRRNARANEPID